MCYLHGKTNINQQGRDLPGSWRPAPSQRQETCIAGHDRRAFPSSLEHRSYRCHSNTCLHRGAEATHGVPAAASRIGVSDTTPPPCPVSPQPGATRERPQLALTCLGRVGETSDGLSLYAISRVTSEDLVRTARPRGFQRPRKESEAGTNSRRMNPLSKQPSSLCRATSPQPGWAGSPGTAALARNQSYHPLNARRI
jgi:hypothetical protein